MISNSFYSLFSSENRTIFSFLLCVKIQTLIVDSSESCQIAVLHCRSTTFLPHIEIDKHLKLFQRSGKKNKIKTKKQQQTPKTTNKSNTNPKLTNVSLLFRKTNTVQQFKHIYWPHQRVQQLLSKENKRYFFKEMQGTIPIVLAG